MIKKISDKAIKVYEDYKKNCSEIDVNIPKRKKRKKPRRGRDKFDQLYD